MPLLVLEPCAQADLEAIWMARPDIAAMLAVVLEELDNGLPELRPLLTNTAARSRMASASADSATVPTLSVLTIADRHQPRGTLPYHTLHVHDRRHRSHHVLAFVDEAFCWHPGNLILRRVQASHAALELSGTDAAPAESTLLSDFIRAVPARPGAGANRNPCSRGKPIDALVRDLSIDPERRSKMETARARVAGNIAANRRGTTLAMLRLAAGLSRSQLAFALGVGADYVANNEAGCAPAFRDKAVARWARALRTDVGAVLQAVGRQSASDKDR